MKMNFAGNLSRFLLFAGLIGVTLGSGCTPPVQGGFRLQDQQQNFALSQQVNTKVDMLWVVDNSPSMEPVQTKVRAGVTQFAQQFMKPTWDIRVATITVDTYLANPSFWAGPQNQTSYLTTVRDKTANYDLPYLNGITKEYGNQNQTVPARSKHYYDATSWVTDLQFPLFNLFQPVAYVPPTVTYNNSGTEEFQSQGMRIVDSKPQMNMNWAKLLVGSHDGPLLSMCWDKNLNSGNFLYGTLNCFHRDDPADSQYHIGTNDCLNPNINNGETGPSQCINTFANNTVHSGFPIISTIPPAGTPGDQNWINSIIAAMQVNLTPSTIGDETERAFQSVLQFFNDNESDSSLALFRKDSLRVIVFVGDEDDQSQFVDNNQYQYGVGMNYGSGTPGKYTPGTGTRAHFVPENASAPYICQQNYPAPNSGYYFPTNDPGYCVDPAWLIPISTVKQDFDNFFHQLDGTTASQPANYFVATITTMNTVGLPSTGFGYIAQRYPALVNAVGNGSLVMDISESDYSPLLNQVGNSILVAKSQFQLSRAPVNQETVQVQIVHQDGSATTLNTSQFTVVDALLTITDLSVIANLSSTDQLSVNYIPSTVY